MKKKLHQPPSTARKALKSSHSLSKEIETDKRHLEKLSLWIDKYCPSNLTDLAVHSKKVAEVQAWLEGHLQTTSTPSSGCFVLMLTGPTGVGKTALVRILAEMLKLDLCEWHAPTPTLWKEHLHHLNSGAPYVSKLQEFKSFLESTRKYASLPVISQKKHESALNRNIEITKLKFILLDDLPPVHNRESLFDLCHCLYSFAKLVKFPTIIIISECLETAGTGEGIGKAVAQLQEALENAGAAKISFNPITKNSIKRVLTRISSAEKYSVDSEVISSIAESCGGDIRHAICTLQFLCLGQYSNESPWDPGGLHIGHPKIKRSKISKTGGSKVLCSDPPFLESQMDQGKTKVTPSCRDGILSLFHALGKLLHNKRHTDKEVDSGSYLNFMLMEELQRQPLNMAAPEDILSQAYTETSTIAAFLHENLLDFIHDDASDDVAIAMSYLSDADYLLGRRSKYPKSSAHLAFLNVDEIDPLHLNDVVAGSIAARGVLFANTHPAPHRWLSLRAPALRQVESALRKRKVELGTLMWTNNMWSLISVSTTTQAVEYEPYLKKMRYNISSSARPFHMHEEVKLDLEADHFEASEAEGEPTLTLSQEQHLLRGIQRSMEVTLKPEISLDETHMDVDDDIEEW